MKFLPSTTQAPSPLIAPAVQTALNALESSKQPRVTGAATTITSANLTLNRALVSDANGKVSVSAASATELGYLKGVTSAIQTQLNHQSAASASAVQSAMSRIDALKLPNTVALPDIGADLVDGDVFPVYDLSTTANKKSVLSRVWTYIKAKINAEPLLSIVAETVKSTGIAYFESGARIGKAGQSNGGLYFHERASGFSEALYFLDSDGTTIKAVFGKHSNDSLCFRAGQGTADNMYLSANGNLLIGTPPPTDSGKRLQISGDINTTGSLYADDVKVLGNQGAAVANATNATDVITQLNALLARLRAHGLIAT